MDALRKMKTTFLTLFGATKSALCLLALVVVGAQAQTMSDEEVDSSNYFVPTELPTLTSNAAFAEEVDPWSGQVLIRHTDLHLPGNGGLDLDIVRQYATPDKVFSHERDEMFYPNQGKYRMGFGWDVHFGYITHPYWTPKSNVGSWLDQLLATEPNGSALSCRQRGQFVSDNRRSILYNDMQLVTQSGGGESLANALGGGYDLVTKSGWRGHCITGGFVLYSPEGLKYTYDKLKYTAYSDRGSLSGPTYSYAFYVSRIEDKFGNWIAVHYRAGDQALIDQVTTSDGRQVGFTYTTLGGYPTLTHISTQGESITYGYDEHRNLVSVTQGDRQLWSYTYQSFYQELERATIYLLKTLVTESGGVVEYSYYHSGRPNVTGKKGLVTTARTTTGTLPASHTQYAYDGSDYHLYNQYGSGVTINAQIIYRNGSTTIKEEDRCTINLYNDIGQGNWLVGTLARRQIYSDNACQQLLQTETYQWDQVKISDQDVSRHFHVYYVGDIGSIVDNAYYKAVLRHKTLTREGTTYTTTYSNFTAFGQAQTEVQSSDHGGSRTLKTTYVNSPPAYGLELPQQQRIEDASGNIVSAVDREYDATYNLSRKTTNGLSVRYTYDSAGNLATITDGKGNTVTHSDYYRGIARRISDTIGTVTKAVDAFGNVTRVTDEQGHSTAYTYDHVNRLRSVTPPVGATTTYNYTQGDIYAATCETTIQPTNMGSVIVYIPHTDCVSATEHSIDLFNQVTLTQGDYRTVHYLDGYNRPLLVKTEDTTNALVRYQRFQYDRQGRTAFASLGSSQQDEAAGTTWEYDSLDRLVKKVTPLGTLRYAYMENNIVRHTDALNHQTSLTHRGFGAPDYGDVVGLTNPSSSGDIVTTLARDPAGRLTRVSQGGFHIDYIYHATYRDHVATEIQPQTQWHQEYDAAGNVTSRWVSAQGKTLFNYDARNRLVKTDYPAGTPDVSYGYYANNLMHTATNGIGDWAYQYNAMGNMTQATLTTAGQHYPFGYQYDDQHHLSVMTYPGGLSVDYAPNAFGEATRAGGYASGVTHYPQGGIKDFTYGNGIRYDLQLSPNQVMIGAIVASHNGSTLIHKRYTYDAETNVTAITDQVRANYSVSNLSYDGLNRLLTASSPAWGGTVTYAYDKTGNITQHSAPSGSTTYRYNATTNQLTDLSGAISQYFSYDLYGNVSDNGKHRFIYNDAGQLISAQDNNGGKVFLYDARGKRVQSYNNDGHRQIEVYDAADRLMLVEQFDGSLKRKIYLGNKLIAYDDNGLVKYQHFDTLGSVIGVSNNARQLVFENYRPYGDKVEAPQDTGNEQWYTGKPFDEDIELSYYGARYYDPAIGRFYANDPIGFRDVYSLNRYAYANNNPYKYIDPTGEHPVLLLLFGGGGSTATATTATTAAVSFTATELAVGAAVGTGLAATAIAVKNESSSPVDDLINTTTPGESTKGRTRNHEKPGTIDTANDDFDSVVDPDTVEDRGNGVRTGTTKDGRKANVRPRSTDGRPTVEIQGEKYKDKIRYDEPRDGQSREENEE